MNHRHQGMTLIEVMTSLLITAMISVVATTVTVAMLSAHSATDAYTDNTQAGRISLAQLQQLIRTSRLVTQSSPTSMTLWVCDDDGSGTIDTDELVRIRFNYETGTLLRIDLVDPTLSEAEAASNILPLSFMEARNWSQASSTVTQSSITQSAIATGLSSVAFRYDRSAPMTKVVAIDATFGSGDQAATLHTSASLRSPATDWVTPQSGQYNLVPPDGVIGRQRPGGGAHAQN